MPCYSIDGVTPVVDPGAYVHPTAVLIGDVIVGPGCYVGPCASLRGDFGRIALHAGANVQDTCVVHGFPLADTVVEEDGHIGHGAVLHACVVRRGALVGMNAVVMDEALREMTEAELARKREGTAIYHDLTRRCLASMVEGSPLRAVEAQRPRLRNSAHWHKR